MRTTDGTLLGGRLRYAQPADGYRTGLEPVLLAASVPARPGQTVLEGGTGAGAGLMCLLARVPGATGIGVEIDPAMATLARRNAESNGMTALSVLTGDLSALALPPADHAMANPPWHDPASTASPIPRRDLAKREAGAGVASWIAALTSAVGEGGSVSVIVSPKLVARSRAALLSAGFGGGTLCELLPKPGRAAKLILLQTWRGRTDPARETSLVLHAEGHTFTPGIERVLRHGSSLDLT